MTQRQIAAGVGKSPAWVNRLLAWRSEGFVDDTPFGPSNAEQRERAKERVQPTEQEPDPEARRKQRERNRRERERQEEQRIHVEAQRIAAERMGRCEGLARATRRRLIGCLGLLGSDKDGEVLAAARKTEEIRRRLNLSWGDLIVLAAEAEQEMAA